ncbi:restriction endonuclease S subunit [Methanolobus tindarius DSM 2278]|uniref:Restriction endonuclease S subunit n=1 Tax=Methanolobus tindarius DSM 2278 TaxID=1090322 RepID=W9E1B1_METTI|nr:restriction endonuclease subunit S [Methanolobus tindarius]ETA69406.1 restriction endonuclease S subunit [Methanolobus tindarius DSM 2278]
MNQEIPENWIKVKFKELAKQKSVRVDDPGESGYEKYVGLEHLDSGELVVKRYGSTSDVTSTMKRFEKDDILFARRNTYLRRVSVAPFDGVCSGDIIVLEPILKHIIKGFLPIFMQFEPFENKIIALSAGAFSKRIKWNQLAEEEVVIPSIEEQKKIVETIWSIQDNIEKNNEVISVAVKLKCGLLNKLLTKGIGHEKFKKTEIGSIPEKWNIYPLSDVITIIGGGTPKTTNPEYWNGSIPWISVEDFPKDGMYIESTVKRITEKGLNESSTKLLQQDDLIISARGTVGLVAKIAKPMAFNQSCYGISSTDKVTSNYAYYLLMILVESIKHSSYGSTFKSITKKNFDLFNVAVPPIEEQCQISEKLDQFYVLQKKALENIDYLYDLKKKLTDECLKGEVRV